MAVLMLRAEYFHFARLPDVDQPEKAREVDGAEILIPDS